MSEPTGSGVARRWNSLLLRLGAVALAIVMFTDVFAVLGRHLGIPLLGSIEVAQAAILVTACAAMVAATLAGTHARVHLLIDRLTPAWRLAAGRAIGLLSAGFFLALTAGSVWIAADLWNAYEESEVLQLPYRPLRVITVVTVVTVSLLFLGQALTGRVPERRESGEAADDAGNIRP